MECIFCKIANRKIPATIMYENDHLIAFDDISPQAPVHKLIIPKIHIANLNALTEENKEIISHITLAAKALAIKLNIADSGYRMIINCNEAAGQTVFHLHAHLLGGRIMTWPPG